MKLKTFASILLTLAFTLSGLAQTKTVSGVLTGSDGEPLPGVSIVIKGTETGTVTDMNGYYSINAPVGSILVFSYIGFINEEIEVTEDLATDEQAASDIEKKKKKIDPNKNNNEGIVSLNDINKKGSYRLRENLEYGNFFNRYWRFKGTFSSSFSVKYPTRLLKTQEVYSQGRNKVYNGPETGEIFSWGPPVKNLEYSGNKYVFDYRGNLVERGTGNNQAALTFDPSLFLKPGGEALFNIGFYAAKKENIYHLEYTNSLFSGIIPLSKMNQNKISFKADNRFSRFLSTGINVDFFQSKANLMNSFSQTRIYSMVMRSPSTFDLLYGLNPSEACKTDSIYLSANNTQRTYAVGNADNPAWLANSITDIEKNNRLFASVKLKSNLFNNFYVFANGSANLDFVDNEFGYSAATVKFEDGLLVKRSENYNSFFSSLGTYYNRVSNKHDFYVSLHYELNQNENNLNRIHSYSETENSNTSFRRSRQAVLKTNYVYNDFFSGTFSAATYNSTGTRGKNYFMPSAGLGFNFSDLIGGYFINFFKVRSSWSETISEAPLQFKRGMLNSTLYNSSGFDNYFEFEDIVNHNNSVPEKINDFDAGIDLGFSYNKYQFTANFYRKTKKGFIFPVYHPVSGFDLLNVADLLTYGYELELTSNLVENYFGWKWRSGINFHGYRTKVEKLLVQEEIKIGGFNDVYSTLSEGEEYGIIVGSAYLKDNQGNMVIGDDGFPLVNPEKQIVGNINPKMMIGWDNSITYRNIHINILFDIRIGGNTWNGTKNTRNYLGVSEETSNERTTRDYIFPGTRPDGSINNIPVDFYDRDLPVTQNRWTKYGYTGVAEDAIEDASYLQLKELSIDWTIPAGFPFIQNIQMKVFALNMFQISKYKGHDPKNMLLGDSQNSGFDYFNLPSVSTYGFSVKFIF